MLNFIYTTESDSKVKRFYIYMYMKNNLLIDTNVSTGFRDLLQAGKILLE